MSEDPRAGDAWRRSVAGGLAFLRRRVTGEYPVDPFGYDPDFDDHVLAPAVRVLYRHWFRIEVEGLEHVPHAGGALVVANHSGTLPLDALMLRSALYDEHPSHRRLRLLAADLVYRVPWLSELSRKAGHTPACPADADRLLRAGELVGVFPEGFKGIGKPFRERYRLQRFGRGGFAASAIRAGVPIVPCAIVGAEEIYPKIAELRSVARLLGLPYVPITPTFPWLGPLGLVPLPSRWIITFAAPIRTDGYGPRAARDPTVVAALADEVRTTVQESLDAARARRGPAF